MIGIIILAQQDMANGLIHAIEHVLGSRPKSLEVQPIDYHADHESLTRALDSRVRRMDDGDGVLILADVFGSSHTNAACEIVRPGQVELVSGVNVPMLLRVLTHRGLGMAALIRKALSGGAEGIVCASTPGRAEHQ